MLLDLSTQLLIFFDGFRESKVEMYVVCATASQFSHCHFGSVLLFPSNSNPLDFPTLMSSLCRFVLDFRFIRVACRGHSTSPGLLVQRSRWSPKTGFGVPTR